jgi:thiol-disulfide isomerase/thioredoxin
MSSRHPKTLLVVAIVCVAVVAAAVVAVASREDDEGAGAGNPDSALTEEEATAPLDGGPAQLVELREQANEIIDVTPAEFDALLADLEGTPVVINKWASWCFPCREEFPYFQRQALERGDEVAFIGLLSDDGPETGATFLEELPLPYPSYLDEDKEIADSFNAGREFPATLFLDARGEVTFTKLGPYTDEEQLAADIERYARG